MATRMRKSNGPEIDRASARTAEEDYFERLGSVMGTTAGIFDPLSNRTFDASVRNRITKEMDERQADVKAMIKRHAERDLMGVYEDMPKNRVMIHEIVHKELLGRASVRVVVAAASFSPTEELVRHGRSCRKASGYELERVREMIVRTDAVFYYVGAFSSTGWDEEARKALAGPNWLIALSDRHEGAWRTWYAPDPRWKSAARIFDLSTEEEKVDAVRRWVLRHTGELLLDELTEDRVFDELGYAIPIVREAFRQIAAEDRYVKYDTSARPYRLTRTYG
jgi:hypothetical protein